MDCYSETNSDPAGRQTSGHHCRLIISCVLSAVPVNWTDTVTVSTTILQNTLFGEHVNKAAWQLTLREDSLYSIRNANLETLKLNPAGGPVGDKLCSPVPPPHQGWLRSIGQREKAELWKAERMPLSSSEVRVVTVKPTSTEQPAYAHTVCAGASSRTD